MKHVLMFYAKQIFLLLLMQFLIANQDLQASASHRTLLTPVIPQGNAAQRGIGAP